MPPLAPVALLALLGGCHAPEPAAPEALPPSAWTPTFEAEELHAPEALAEAISEAWALARAWDAAPAFQAWQEAMRWAEPACPGFSAQGPAMGWVADCETSAGARFRGYGYLDLPPGGFARAWWGAATVHTPEGATIHLAGRAELQQEPGTALPARSELHGSFAVTGGPSEATSWMQAGVHPDLLILRARGATSTERLELHGSASGLALAGGRFQAVDFEDATLLRVEDGPLEPAGAVSLRDGDGHWWTVRFDGPSAPGEPAGDGCGVHSGAEDSAPVCVDLSGVLEEAW